MSIRRKGARRSRKIARITGGIERTAWDDVFDASRLRNRQVRDLVLPLALLLLVLHVAEIAGRRLLLFAAAQGWLRAVSLPRLRWPSRKRAAVRDGTRPSMAPTVAEPVGTAAEPTRAGDAEASDVGPLRVRKARRGIAWAARAGRHPTAGMRTRRMPAAHSKYPALTSPP